MFSRFLFIFILTFPCFVAAQEESRDQAGGFYNKDFAKNPLGAEESKDDSGFFDDFKNKPKSEQRGFENKDPSDIMPKKSEERESPDEDAPSPNELKIKGMGILLNGVDEEHCFQQLNRLADIVTEKNIPTGRVIIVGGVENVGRLIKKLLLNSFNGSGLYPKVGGFIEGSVTVPERYKVTLSPSWLIDTEKGEVVLEGVEKVERYITSRGTFVERF